MGSVRESGGITLVSRSRVERERRGQVAERVDLLLKRDNNLLSGGDGIGTGDKAQR
jgi:hypothetical protein